MYYVFNDDKNTLSGNAYIKVIDLESCRVLVINDLASPVA